MSDLGAIFHVKKDGTQYDAHAYTTEDECPSPNLKIKTKDGTQAYVKLTDNGSGDVPLRVKPKSSGTTYQVKTVAIPTGSVTYAFPPYSTSTLYKKTYKFTVPAGITRVKLFKYTNYPIIVGVTANKTYTIILSTSGYSGEHYDTYHHSVFTSNATWFSVAGEASSTTIYWSPEINAQTPTVTDY
jgi:hypothetical protein